MVDQDRRLVQRGAGKAQRDINQNLGGLTHAPQVAGKPTLACHELLAVIRCFPQLTALQLPTRHGMLNRLGSESIARGPTSKHQDQWILRGTTSLSSNGTPFNTNWV